MAEPRRRTNPDLILPDHPTWVALWHRAWDAAGVSTYADLINLVRSRPHLASAAYPSSPEPNQVERRQEADRLATRSLEQLARLEGEPTAETLLALIALLVEKIVGIQVSDDEQTVTWQLRRQPPIGVRDLRLTRNTISMVAEGDTGAGIVLLVEAKAPFYLEIEAEFATFSERVPSGATRYLLTHLDRTDVRQET